MNKNEASFTVSVTGEVTQERWVGKFTVKTRMSHRDFLVKDRLRREYLGASPESASPRAASSAEILAQLAVRVTEAPSWWTGNDNGAGLADDNIVGAVYENALKMESDEIEALKKAAEAAKTELKTEAAKVE